MMKAIMKAIFFALVLSVTCLAEKPETNNDHEIDLIDLSLEDLAISEQVMIGDVSEGLSELNDSEDFLGFPRRLQDGTVPKPVWIMSFPESGVSHMMDIIQKSSGKATATNYGHITLETDGSFKRSTNSEYVYPNGPIWYNTELPKPEKYVATRSHGTGYCLFCHPKEYYFGNFWWSSSKGVKLTDGQRGVLQYNPADVKKMIHVLRDPYDTVVARFYSYIGLMNANRPELNIEERFPLNEKGFKDWCKFQDDGFQTVELKFLPPELRQLALDVPCRQEFVKYANFHTRAFLMGRFRELQTMILRYDDYVKDQTSIIHRVNQFLELPVENTDIPQTIVGDGIWNFRDFYTDEERMAIERLIRNLSVPPIWFHISFYTPDFYHDPIIDDPDYHRVNENT